MCQSSHPFELLCCLAVMIGYFRLGQTRSRPCFLSVGWKMCTTPSNNSCTFACFALIFTAFCGKKLPIFVLVQTQSFIVFFAFSVGLWVALVLMCLIGVYFCLKLCQLLMKSYRPRSQRNRRSSARAFYKGGYTRRRRREHLC